MHARRRSLLVGLLAALAAPGIPTPVEAQATNEEAATVLIQTAAAFRSDGRDSVARAIYEYVLRRYPRTPASAEARTQLVEMGAEPPPETQVVTVVEEVAGGRTELIVWTTTYGLFLGVAVPTALGADDSAPYGVGLLLGGPAGYAVGRSLAGDRDLTEGQARAITLGGTWGTWQGAALRDVLDIGEREVCFPGAGCFIDDDSDEETFAAMVVGGVAGIAIGSVLSHKRITAGTASAANFGSLWGTWFGIGTGVLFDLEDDALLTAALVGGNAGLIYTALMAPRWGVTRNRARMVSIAGVIGLFAGAGINLIVEPDDDRVAIGIPMTTSVIGLAFGAAGTAGTDAAAGQEPPEGPSGSLVSLDHGALRIDTPLPFPVVRERPGPRGIERRPGLGVTLFRATFR